jgi:hypothetical protein
VLRNKKNPLNITIIIPGLHRKSSPAARRRANIIFTVLATVMCGTIVIGGMLGLAFFAGFTYSQVHEHADSRLASASFKTPEAAVAELNAHIKYLNEVQMLYPVAVAQDGRTGTLLANRAAQLESLKAQAAMLQGKADADSMRAFMDLRKRIRAVPALAGSLTWKLLTEDSTIMFLVFIGIYLFFGLVILGPQAGKLSQIFEKLGKKFARTPDVAMN